MASVATGPSNKSFQCLYVEGSVRKSTMTGVPLSAMPSESPHPRMTQSALALLGPMFSQPWGVPPSR